MLWVYMQAGLAREKRGEEPELLLPASVETEASAADSKPEATQCNSAAALGKFSKAVTVQAHRRIPECTYTDSTLTGRPRARYHLRPEKAAGGRGGTEEKGERREREREEGRGKRMREGGREGGSSVKPLVLAREG